VFKPENRRVVMKALNSSLSHLGLRSGGVCLSAVLAAVLGFSPVGAQTTGGAAGTTGNTGITGTTGTNTNTGTGTGGTTINGNNTGTTSTNTNTGTGTGGTTINGGNTATGVPGRPGATGTSSGRPLSNPLNRNPARRAVASEPARPMPVDPRDSTTRPATEPGTPDPRDSTR
jgi:hypothetical protein